MAFQIRRDDVCACGKPVKAGSMVDYQKGQRPAIRHCPACDASLAPAAPTSGQAAPDTSYMAKLEVRVVRETWRKPDGSTAIVKCSVEGGLSTNDPNIGTASVGVIGPWASKAEPGSVWEVHGTWKHDKKYGWSLQASIVVPAMGTTDEDVIAYLRGNIPHLGGTRAKQLFDLFGSREALFTALAACDPKMTEVSGITDVRAAEIAAAYVTTRDKREALIGLGSLGLGPALIARVLKHFEDEPNLMHVIQGNPYKLLSVRGIGWDKADAAAHKLGVADDDIRRGAAALSILLEEEASEGHTYMDLSDLGAHESRHVAQPAPLPEVNFGGSASIF